MWIFDLLKKVFLTTMTKLTNHRGKERHQRAGVKIFSRGI